MSLRSLFFSRPTNSTSKKAGRTAKKASSSERLKDESRKRRNFGRVGSLPNFVSRPEPPSYEADNSRPQLSPPRRPHSREAPPQHLPATEEFAGFSPDPIVLSPDRMDKLLDTLTQRELQLSSRIDRADEAVAAARTALRECPRGTPGHEAVRRRALNAARKRRTLENSLAVTTQQADCVLRAMGVRGYVSLEDRLETRLVQSRIEAEEAVEEAEHVASGFMTTFGGEIGPHDEEQIAKEVEEHLHTQPQNSDDWVAEAHAKASRAGRIGREDRAQEHIDPRMHNLNNVVAEGVDGTRRRAQGMSAEPRVSTERPRTSMDRIRAKIPNGTSFYRRNRGEKHR